MINDQMPEWARAMEERAEAREHLLFNEIAIVRAEMKVGFERVFEDMVLSIDIADQAYTATDHTRDDVSSNRKELIRLWKRLNTLQQRVGFGKTSPPPEDVA